MASVLMSRSAAPLRPPFSEESGLPETLSLVVVVLVAITASAPHSAITSAAARRASFGRSGEILTATGTFLPFSAARASRSERICVRSGFRDPASCSFTSPGVLGQETFTVT